MKFLNDKTNEKDNNDYNNNNFLQDNYRYSNN